MRQPLAQPITLDFDQVWLIKTARGRALLDVLSSGEVAGALAQKADRSDPRFSDARPPLAHGAASHDSTVEATANKGVAGGYCDLDGSGKVPSARLPSTSALGVVPIGCIVAWHKSLSGVPALPAEFLECNGQTVSDAASPLNGQTLPDLNGGNQFLRGNAASGGTGGATSHYHGLQTLDEDHSNYVQITYDNNGDGSTGSEPVLTTHYGMNTDGVDSQPPFTDMVWIMRIK